MVTLPPQKKRIGSAGFSLVEIVIVILLIGIVSAVAAPLLLKYLPNMHLKSAARDLFSSMQEARMAAIKNNSPVAIIFNNSGDADPTNDSYAVYDDPGPDGNWGTLADNNLVKATNLITYKGDAQFGHLGLAGNQSVTGGLFPGDHISYGGLAPANPKWVLFNESGTANGGYVYLDNGSSLFAVGTRTSGFISLQRWQGGAAWE